MIDFIGDLSRNDALVLKELAEAHNRIVEFGVGGSTQILGHYTKGRVTSYDTSEYWIRKTKTICLQKNIENVYFIYFNSIHSLNIPKHDFLFIDGYRELRALFASKAIDSCRETIAFHDTRVRRYTEKIMPFIHVHWNRIECIDVNFRESNITVIHLRDRMLTYEDWNKIEGRTNEQIGIT